MAHTEANPALSAHKVRHEPMMPKDKKGQRRAYEVWWECSNCNSILRGGYLDSPVSWKYCPHCGARFHRESDTYG